MALTMKELLEMSVKNEATDLHVVVGEPPIFRVHGELKPAPNVPPLSAVELQGLIFSMLNDKQKAIFFEKKELDFSYLCMEGYQFRVNVYSEKNNIASTIRITSTKIRNNKELGLPKVIDELVRKRKGLIILSGTAGSGKTTTMTYLIDMINNERKSKVVTIEDPIEFVHKSKQSLIVQREVGTDTESFATALKYALRQDPDVVVVGEMRDFESISMALTTAETGHLVISTLHAPDTVETISRIIDVCGGGKEEQIRLQLAENLIAVIGQTLIPRKDMVGRVLATEVLTVTLPIRNLIRRGAFVEIRGQLDSMPDSGMHSLEKCLSDLYRQGVISEETARDFAKYHHALKL